MSRYVAKVGDGRSLHYGFDRPLQEYFMVVFSSEGDPVENFTARGDILDYLDENDLSLPDEHMGPMVLDLPF